MANPKYSSKEHLCLLLFPFKKAYYNNLTSMLQSSVEIKKLTNSASRLIDFVICKFMTQKLLTTLEVNAFDPTFSENQKKENKVKEFFM